MARKRIHARAINKNPKALRTTLQPVPAAKNSGDRAKVIRWGSKDNLPNEILTAIMDSGTASACWEKRESFIQADGFSNRTAADFQINPDQTADDLLSDVASDTGWIHGYALRIKYSLNLTPAEAYWVPVQTIRRLEDGTFIINPNMGTPSYKKADDELIKPYDPNPEAVREMLNEAIERAGGDVNEAVQTGQLLFRYRRSARSLYYPHPGYWTLAGSRDIYSDTEIALTDLDNLENNFTPPVIFYQPGEVDATKEDEAGKTELDYLTEEVQSLTSKENRSQAVVLTGKTKDDAPQLIAWDNSKPVLALDAKRDTIARAVCRHFGVPPILIGLYQAGALGESRQILNAIQLMQNDINPLQRMISRDMQMLFPNADPEFWNISTLSPLDVIPTELLAFMSEEQRTNLIERYVA